MSAIFDYIILLFELALPVSLLALGIFLTYRILDFADLTAEGSLLIGASLTGLMIVIGLNPFLATFIGAIGGAVCGLITGLLNRILKIPKLLSGIITMTASSSIAMLIMGFDFPTGFLNNYLSLGENATFYSLFYVSEETNKAFINSVGFSLNQCIEIIVMAIIVVGVIFALYYFFGTEYGMAIRNTGMNEKMAKSQGINTTIATIACVAISNAVIGLGGALYVQVNHSIEVGDFSGYLVVGLASILVGEAIFGKRSFKNWLISVSLGALVYFIIIAFAQVVIKVKPGLMQLLYAVLIVVALCLPTIKKWVVNLFKKKDEPIKEV